MQNYTDTDNLDMPLTVELLLLLLILYFLLTNLQSISSSSNLDGLI